MFALPQEELPPQVRDALETAHARLLNVGDYPARVEAAPRHWDNVRVGVGRPVRDTLRAMCTDAEPCCYCGDSVGANVDHIRPKFLYPDQTFVWTNLLLACSRCNTVKGDRFAVFVEDELVEVTRERGAAIVEPRAGDMVLIDLRREDPLDFLRLDLATGVVLSHRGLPARALERANYTRTELLRLNDGPLPARRCQAYGNFKARVQEYDRARKRGADTNALAGLQAELLRLPNQMVWQEMKRQHATFAPLSEIFATIPDALEW